MFLSLFSFVFQCRYKCSELRCDLFVYGKTVFLWAVLIQNRLLVVFVVHDRVERASLWSVFVHRAFFPIMEDASSLSVFESKPSVVLDVERLGGPCVLYFVDVVFRQYHVRLDAAFDAVCFKTAV